MTGLERLYKAASAFIQEYPQYTKSMEAAAKTDAYAKQQAQDTQRMKEVPRNAPMFMQTVTNDEKPATTPGAALYSK